MTREGLLVGVDAGATSVRAGVGWSPDRVLARARARAVRLADGPVHLARAIARTVAEAGAAAGISGPARALAVGAAGAGDDRAAGALGHALAALGLADRWTVVTDAELVLADAFPDGAGIALLGGTGSIAMGRLASGEVVRAGGLGPAVGDPGSGYAIGRAAAGLGVEACDTPLLHRILDHVGLRDPADLAPWLEHARPAEVAALAPVVMRAARAGEPAAEPIVEAAARDLAALVVHLVPHFVSGEVVVALAGGLFHDPWFRRRVEDAVAAASLRARVRGGECDAVRGALKIAARLATDTP